MTVTGHAALAAPLHCAWCGAELGPGAQHMRGRTLCRCGAATTDPWPSEADLDQAYGSWYRPDSGRFSGMGDAILRRTRGLLARRIDRIAPRGPVLDVGAGDGALLDALRACGRSATGLERHSQRPDVLETPLTEMEGEWAAVVLWHSLEHLREPGAALEHAAGLLAPGGVLIVAIPNAGSVQARLFGDRWFALDIPRHLVHLPAPLLLRRMGELDLRLERVSFLRGGQSVFGWLHGLVGTLPGNPDLYDSVRRPEARGRPLSRGMRAGALGAACLLAGPAGIAAGAEGLARRGGSVYVEAHRA